MDTRESPRTDNQEFDPIEARAVSISLAEAALGLGVSTQRLRRLMERHKQASARPVGQTRLNLEQVETLARTLSDEPITSLTKRQTSLPQPDSNHPISTVSLPEDNRSPHRELDTS